MTTGESTPEAVLSIATEHIRRAARTGRRTLVAVDGIGASGKTTFAAALAERIDDRPSVVIHVDDFFNPAEVRHARGRHSPEGFWLDTYDYESLIRGCLEPMRHGAASKVGHLRPLRSSQVVEHLILDDVTPRNGQSAMSLGVRSVAAVPIHADEREVTTVLVLAVPELE